MGVIVTEEYLCDYCTKRIPNADVLVGRLSLRKQGARGLGRDGPHAASGMSGEVHCQGHRRRPQPAFRNPNPAQAVAEPEIPAELEAPSARRRRKRFP